MSLFHSSIASSSSLSDFETLGRGWILNDGICVAYRMNLNHKPYPAAPLPVYRVSSPCGRQFDNDEQRTVVVHRMVASRCRRHGTWIVCDYGSGGSREARLRYLSWVGAGDGARRSRVIVMGARRRPWVVGSSHEHSLLLLIDDVDRLMYGRILCKAIVVVNPCGLQVVGARGRCGGSGGRSPALVEGGW